MPTQFYIILALATGLLTSCGSNAPGKPKPIGPVSSALHSGHWKRVRTNPPTYFPAGTPADHPTDYLDGVWVDSGDSQGSRFFIPDHGTALSQEHLVAEAQQAMTPEAKAALKGKGRRIVAGDIAGKTLEGVFSVIGAMGQAMASMPSTGYYRPPKNQPTPPPTTPAPSTPPASGE